MVARLALRWPCSIVMLHVYSSPLLRTLVTITTLLFIVEYVPGSKSRKTQHSLVGTLFQCSAKLPLNLVGCELNSKHMHSSSSFSVCPTVGRVAHDS
ncbi:hypothetical protein F4604DRAFT_1702873 [Suillus subluteus]|nr:hypothetical protein F4604DRAFT_1702873 [Suillus subluteus]